MKELTSLPLETQDGKKTIYSDILNLELGELLNLKKALSGTDSVRVVDRVLYERLFAYRSYFDYTDSGHRKEEKKNRKIKKKNSFKFKGGRK